MRADDYLTKPFSIEELILKIRVFLRRSQIEAVTTGTLPLGSYIVNVPLQQLTDAKGNTLRLTHREVQLLSFLMKHKNELLARETILLHLWKDDDYFAGRK